MSTVVNRARGKVHKSKEIERETSTAGGQFKTMSLCHLLFFSEQSKQASSLGEWDLVEIPNEKPRAQSSGNITAPELPVKGMSKLGGIEQYSTTIYIFA